MDDPDDEGGSTVRASTLDLANLPLTPEGKVMNYPKAIKAFCIRVNDDGRTVAALDVLAPGIAEIIGGSQREERPPSGDRNILPQSAVASYLWCMTKLLEQAIEAVRRLPADSQDESARAIFHLAASEVAAEPVDPAHLAAVLEGLAQAKRREFATVDEVEAALRRFDE
jgi:predicted transcriptional regulator